MDESSIPRRRIWQEILLVLAVLLESVLGIAWADAWWDVVLAVLTVVLGGALLARFGQWRTLLPAVIVANVVAGSLVVGTVALFCYASREPRRALTLAATAVSCATVVLSVLLQVEAPDRTLMIVIGVVTMLLGASTGMYMGARRELLHGLRQRAELAETRAREAQEEARSAERRRIAREMHDIVAHKISLVALQAGALEVNPALDREKVAESAGLIRSAATEALSELRAVLGVLRGDDDTAPLAPQPTWDDVRALVRRSQDAGIKVDLFDFIDAPVPDSLARTAYRVVQEGLTNIHKHARHTAARVALMGEPGDELVVEVSNVLPQGYSTDLPGARMGLSGIETRVLHAGGTITSGPTDDGRFDVKAVIPWPTAP
ncbi:sensor histidine kinase [Brachybacterium huguangmaarense]